MATINGTTDHSYWTYKLEASETSYSIDNNTSVVSVTAYVGRTGSNSYLGGSYSGSITVNGQTQSHNGTISYPTYVNVGSWLALYTKTFTVGHNSDGSKTVSISSSMSSSDFNPHNCSASGSLTLTKIPRQANITSAPDFNDEANPTINYSNPAGNSVNSLQARIENSSGTSAYVGYRDISKTGSSYTFSLTSAERQTLRQATPNSNQLKVKFVVRTIIGNNTYYSTSDKTMTIINANPTFEEFDYHDGYTGYGTDLANGTNTSTLTGNYKTIIKGYSTLLVEISEDNKAIANKEATMSNYKVEDIVHDWYSEEYDTHHAFIPVEKYTKNTITVYAVDSRGNATAVTKDISSNFIDYSEIGKQNITLERNDNGVGEQMTLTYNGTFWNDNFGVVQNSITATYRYKKTTSNTWIAGTTTINPTINSNNFNYSGIVAGDTEQHGFDINESYDFEVTVSDKIMSTTFSAILGAGSPAIAVYKNKVALGNKYDTSLGGEVQLWGDVYLNGYNIIDSGNNSNGSWFKYSDGTMLCYKTITFSGLSFSSAWGSVYETPATQSFGATPQTFISTPIVFTSIGDGAFANVEGIHNASVDSFGEAQLFRPVKGSATIILNLLAIGKWG